MDDGFDIPYHDLGPQDRPPQLVLVAGLQGNELNGVFVLLRLASFLSGIARGDRPGQYLCERVIIIPGINVLGADLFLDRADSDTTRRIVATALAITRHAYYRVDIWNSSLDLEEMPQVRLYAPNDDERATACLFGLPAVVEWPLDGISSTRLIQAWREYRGENFAIQAGLAGSLQPAHCEAVFRALIAFLDRTGIITGVTLSDEEEDLHYFGLNQTFSVIADQSGIFVSRLNVGFWLQAGDSIGHIYDGFTGDIRTEVFAPVSGLVSSLRRRPLLFEGDLVARIQIRTPDATGIDRGLHAGPGLLR